MYMWSQYWMILVFLIDTGSLVIIFVVWYLTNSLMGTINLPQMLYKISCFEKDFWLDLGLSVHWALGCTWSKLGLSITEMLDSSLVYSWNIKKTPINWEEFLSSNFSTVSCQCKDDLTLRSKKDDLTLYNTYMLLIMIRLTLNHDIVPCV